MTNSKKLDLANQCPQRSPACVRVLCESCREMWSQEPFIYIKNSSGPQRMFVYVGYYIDTYCIRS